MTLHDALGVAVGSTEVVLGLVVAVSLARFGRAFPWLVALMAFFVVRGATRVWTGVGGSVGSLGDITDGLVLLVLVTLTVALPSTIRRLRRAQTEASLREHEYRRALVEYRVLARHRLANGITIVRGAADTLLARRVDAETRDELLRALSLEATRLEDALEPIVRSSEERGLRPAPQLDDRREVA